MASGTLDDQYFAWLYKSIGSVSTRNPTRSHWGLARQLYQKPYFWSVPNDDNREQDGKDLRYEFITECDLGHVDQDWLDLECSMLEMLIALSRHVSDQSFGASQGSAIDWFWKLMDNVDLRKYTDSHYGVRDIPAINRVLNSVMERKYNRNGVGGLFPLQEAHADQRRIELWYQMSSYLLEGERRHIGP